MKGHELCKSLNAKYPQIQLSFGYIGNCGQDSGGWFDDRSWRFFTNVTRPDGQGCFSWPIGGVPTGSVEGLQRRAETKLEPWLIETVLPHTK